MRILLSNGLWIHCGQTLLQLLVYIFRIDFQVSYDYTVNEWNIYCLHVYIIMYNNINQIKAFYPLETWENNKILRTKSEQVDIFDDEIKEFCDILIDLMYEYDWAWLAAPQVWKNIRIIATTQWKEEKKWGKTNNKLIWETAMINPEIIEHSKEKKKGEEGCLSVPWVRWDVERWTSVVVKYQDKKWKQHVNKYTGQSAVVIQHEIDHLDWILYTDKIIWELREFKEEE